MKGLFCGSKARTNDEYKSVIKSRMNIFIILFVIGSITLGVTSYLNFNDLIKDDHILGIYSGAGTGLIAISILLWVKNKLLLKNESKLKESRINNSDERIQEISNKALKIATIALLIALYAIGFIGGLYNPILFTVLSSSVAVFLVTYVISYKMLERKM